MSFQPGFFFWELRFKPVDTPTRPGIDFRRLDVKIRKAVAAVIPGDPDSVCHAQIRQDLAGGFLRAKTFYQQLPQVPGETGLLYGCGHPANPLELFENRYTMTFPGQLGAGCQPCHP